MIDRAEAEARDAIPRFESSADGSFTTAAEIMAASGAVLSPSPGPDVVVDPDAPLVAPRAELPIDAEGRADAAPPGGGEEKGADDFF